MRGEGTGVARLPVRGNLQQAEIGLGEGAAHQCEGLRAAEVMVARVRGAALPQRDFGRRNQVGFVLSQELLFLRLGHRPVRIGVLLMFRVEVVLHLPHLVVLPINGREFLRPERSGLHGHDVSLELRHRRLGRHRPAELQRLGTRAGAVHAEDANDEG
jgi:hypothetical protein